MKKLDLGQTVSVLANVGVIAGIVFLGYELRQNNEAIRAQSDFNQHQVRLTALRTVAENPNGLVDLWVTERDGGELTEADRIRLLFFAESALVDLEWQYRELNLGRLSAEELDVSGWQASFDMIPLLEEQFQANKAGADPEFVRYVEENIVNR